MEDRVGTWNMNGREITDVERFPLFPVDRNGMDKHCRQCVSDYVVYNAYSDFLLHFVNTPDDDEPNPTIVYRAICDGLRDCDSPNRCALKIVQYKSRDSDEVITEMYADEEYERQLKSPVDGDAPNEGVSKFRNLIRKFFGKKSA